ncbi:MAG: hypothetical protein LBE46_04145 [Wolbachia pipientis]|nr:hypothetical protein [Wolbachia pipientis]
MSTIKISYSKYVIDLLYNCYLSERSVAHLLVSFQRVKLEFRKKRNMDPSVTHWDDKRYDK